MKPHLEGGKVNIIDIITDKVIFCASMVREKNTIDNILS